MWHMRKASIRDLHIHTSELVRDAEDGSVIVIERRGEPVAELRAYTRPVGVSAEAKARIHAEMEELWARMPPSSSDSTAIIEEDRNR
jgi:antitoxin (DNA-binding transcriptional repressor) of toxin-antitoxin stability system